MALDSRVARAVPHAASAMRAYTTKAPHFAGQSFCMLVAIPSKKATCEELNSCPTIRSFGTGSMKVEKKAVRYYRPA